MTSTRLPGKVLLPANGKPMLGHLIDRLKAVPSLAQIVLATTINATDDVLAGLGHDYRIAVFRGSEDDVMNRVIGAADSAKADVVVGITGDCPIIDPMIVEQAIRLFRHNPCDYAHNRHIPGYPDGMGVQVYWLDCLKRSAALTDDRLDHEHVTLHMRKHPELFRHLYLVAPPDMDWPDLGLTLDEREDYVLLKNVIEYFSDANPLFGCREVIKLLRSRPEWLALNRDVQRKGAT